MLRNEDYFINSSSKSLQAVLLHNKIVFHLSLLTIQYKWITHNCVDYLLSAFNYKEHKWLIYGNLKVIEQILGIQGGYTKYYYFLCLWDRLSVEVMKWVKTWFT